MDFDSDRIRLHYQVNGPERGTPLVAVHGFASSSLVVGYGYAGILVAFIARQSPFAIIPVAPYESMREMTARLLEKRDAGFPVALAGGHLKGTFFYTACSVPMPRDINDLPRPEWGPPLFCLVKDRYRLDLEGWARRGGFDLTTVERRGSLSMVEVSR